MNQSEAIDHALAQALREAGFADDQCARLVKKLKPKIRFLLAKNPNALDSDPLFKFHEKLSDLATRFKKEGASYDTFLQAAIKTPSILLLAPATLERNVRDVVRAFEAEGLTTKAYLRAALKEPSLLTQSATSIENNIRGVANAFAKEELSAKSYLAAALERPALFHQTPKRVQNNIRTVVAAFASDGLTTKDYLGAALKAPDLFYRKPRKIIKNVRSTVSLFAKEGMTKADYIALGLKHPPLLKLRSKRIHGNIVAVVQAFEDDGLTTEAYLMAAKKQPSLFYQAPETICGHIRKIKKLYAEGKIELSKAYASFPAGDPRALMAYLVHKPILLTFSDNNLELRSVYGDMRQAMRDAGRDLTRKSLNVMEETRGALEKRIARSFNHPDGLAVVRPEQTELYALVQRGLFRTLSCA